MLHVGPKNEIGVTFPGFELVLLRGGYGAGDHLEHILWRAATAVLNANADSKNTFCAKLASGNGRNLSHETAVGETASTDFDRFEEARKRTAGANGVHQPALRENNWIASGKVR